MRKPTRENNIFKSIQRLHPWLCLPVEKWMLINYRCVFCQPSFIQFKDPPGQRRSHMTFPRSMGSNQQLSRLGFWAFLWSSWKSLFSAGCWSTGPMVGSLSQEFKPLWQLLAAESSSSAWVRRDYYMWVPTEYESASYCLLLGVWSQFIVGCFSLALWHQELKMKAW